MSNEAIFVFKNVSDIMIIFFNLDENHNEIDCDANEDFETINNDVSENDDEIRPRKRSTKIASWFFSSLKRVTDDDDSVERMTSDNDDDNVVSDEFEHDANSIQNESYFLSVTLIQFLLMNSLLVTSMITWRKSIYNFNSL